MIGDMEASGTAEWAHKTGALAKKERADNASRRGSVELNVIIIFKTAILRSPKVYSQPHLKPGVCILVLI